MNAGGLKRERERERENRAYKIKEKEKLGQRQYFIILLYNMTGTKSVKASTRQQDIEQKKTNKENKKKQKVPREILIDFKSIRM